MISPLLVNVPVQRITVPEEIPTLTPAAMVKSVYWAFSSSSS
jgi:hypothetical protein